MAKQTRGTSAKTIKETNTRVFHFLVEGFSELAYIEKLKQSFKKAAKIHNNKGGGAKSVLEEATNFLNKPYELEQCSALVVWFDKDHTYKENQIECDKLIKDLMKKSTDKIPIYIVFSKPVTEHWFMLHFGIKEKKSCTSSNETYEKALKKLIPNYTKGGVDAITAEQICDAWKELDTFIKKVKDERDNNIENQCFPLDFETDRMLTYLALHNYFCS